jgi:hypothetical protein
MVEHVLFHCRRHDCRGSSRKRDETYQVVGEAERKFRNGRGRRGSDHQQVGVLCETDVPGEVAMPRRE